MTKFAKPALKSILLPPVLALALTACATGPTAYEPAKSDSATGYTQTRIENDRFRVGFTARSAQEANNFALLRAAELATENGYSHFEIVSAGRDAQQRRAGGPSVGVGLGTGGYRSGASVGIGIPLGGKPKVRQDMEVKLRRGGTGSNVYDAAQVIRDLGGVAKRAT